LNTGQADSTTSIISRSCLGNTDNHPIHKLAPEHPFPTGVNDAWDALRWVAANASALSADPTLGFIVGGTSAGGNITAVITHLARDCNLQPPLTGQYLSVPALLPADVVPEKYRPEYLSLTSNVSDPVLGGMDTGTIYSALVLVLSHLHVSSLHHPVSPRQSCSSILHLCFLLHDFADLSPETQTMEELTPAIEAYKPDSSSPLFAPFNHPAGHTGVPRAYFQVCGMDPLRDHALICERVLREEYGIDTKLDLYPGFGHTFWANWPEMEMSRKFVNDTLEGMKWLLSAGKVGVVSQEGEPI
jgi:acetyl esterase/lipase